MNQSFVVFFTYLLLSAAANTLDPEMKAGSDFTRATCDRTSELKDLCISVINSNPCEDLKSNLTGFLAIFINETLHVVIDDHSYLLNQTLNGQLDNRTLQVFRSCASQYQMSKDSLRVLLEDELLKQHNADLNMDLGQIDNYLALCEMEFEGFIEEPSAWKTRYDYVSSLLILSLQTTNLIKCNRIHVC
ncbi:hypothetical protein SDJN03_18554, partial [Cucurbita argyrosperma subsp. sororia]